MINPLPSFPPYSTPKHNFFIAGFLEKSRVPGEHKHGSAYCIFKVCGEAGSMMTSPGFTGFFALASLHSLPWVCISQIKPEVFVL